jgi:hypothetical protein
MPKATPPVKPADTVDLTTMLAATGVNFLTAPRRVPDKIVVLNRMAHEAGPSSSTRRPLAGAGRRTKKSEVHSTSTTARTGIHGVVSAGLGTAAAGSGRLKAAALASTGGAMFNGAAALPLVGATSFFMGLECMSRGARAS